MMIVMLDLDRIVYRYVIDLGNASNDRHHIADNINTI